MHQQETKREENSIPTIAGEMLERSPSVNQNTQVPGHANQPKETKEQESSKDSTKSRVVSIFDTPEPHDRKSPEIDANSPNKDKVNGLQSHFLDVKGSPVRDSLMFNNIISFLTFHQISIVKSFGKILADDDNFAENLKSLFSNRFLGICSPIHETGQSFFILKLGSRCYCSDSLSKQSWNHLKIDLDMPDASLIYCESSVDIKELKACNYGGHILKRSDFGNNASTLRHRLSGFERERLVQSRVGGQGHVATSARIQKQNQRHLLAMSHPIQAHHT